MQQLRPFSAAVTPGRGLRKHDAQQALRESGAKQSNPPRSSDFYASVSTVSAGHAQEVGSAGNSRFLQDLDSSGDAHFKHSSPEHWDGDDDFFSRTRKPLSYSDLGATQNTSALPLPSAAGFEDEADDVLHAEQESTIPPCPPTPSRTPGYARDGPLVRQNSLGESKLLIASQQSDAAASNGPDTNEQAQSLHDSFEGWSTIGQGSFSIAFQVSICLVVWRLTRLSSRFQIA